MSDIVVGTDYRYKDHIGTITTVERFLNKDNEWYIALVVSLPTMPKGQQWLSIGGPEVDFVEEIVN